MKTSHTSNLVRCAVLLLAGGLCVPSAWAQFSSSIEGTVADSSGAAVPSAGITLTNKGTGIKTTVQTNSAGYFLFPSLPAGVFNLTASGSGFKTVEIADLRLETGTRRTSNMVLEVGTQSTVVTVQAEVAAVDLSDAKVAGVIESKQLADLPIPGRNFMALVNLTPGVIGTQGGNDVFSAQRGVGSNAAGLRSEQNGFAVDGGTVTSMVRHGEINLQPNTEAIEEVQITVNNFSAAAGNDAGASVRVLTKSGTNDYHGSLNWFHQNNVLTSRSVFQSTVNSANGRALPASRRNEVQGSLGGPIKRNKTFLFATFDILRTGNATNNTSSVETPELVRFLERTIPNNKSTFLFKNYPAAFTPYLNIRTAQQVLGAANCGVQGAPSTSIASIPCSTPIIGDGVTPVVSIRNGKQWSLRGDHMITEKDRLYVNVFRTGERSTSGNTTRPIMTYLQENLNWFGNVNHTHTFSSSLLNEIRANVVRVHGEIQCVECQIPVLNITGGLNGFGVGGPTPFIQNNYELHDTLTWIKGGHNIKAGFQIGRLQANWKPTAGYQRPTFTFQTVLDFLNDNPFSESNIGFNPKDGSVYTPDAAERQHVHAGFIDDTWKVRSNLTVTLGLRWESYGKVDQATLGNNVQFRSGNDSTSRIADGKNLTSKTILQNGDWNNFAPRLSFAWDPKGNGKNSIRGGVGVFYDFMPSQLYGGGHYTPPIFSLLTVSPQTAPLLPRYAFGASGTNPYQFPRPFGLEGIVGQLDERNGSIYSRADITWTDPSLRNSYTFNYFFGLQRSLTSTVTVEANYVGNMGRKLYSKYNVNRFPGDLIQNNGVARRLNPSFGSITYGQSNLTSSYNGGNFSVRKRYSDGFLFQAAYTIGNALSYSDSFSGFQFTDWWNLNLDKGAANFNVAQKLALSAVWDVPSLKMGSVSQLITKGWQLSGVTILQSGGRFSVTCGQAFTPVRTNGIITGNSGCDFNADGTNGDRPNAPAFGSTIDMDKQTLIGAGTFRAADFPKPALGQVGNLGRNTYTNPGYAGTDLALMRNFRAPFFVSEGLNIQFRAEAFNAFNRVNLGGITSDTNSTNFGRVTGISGNPRRFQFGLRLSF